MLPLFFRTVFPASHNLVWLGFMLLFPAAVLGQAGGSPPIVFHAADPVNAAGSAGGEHPAKLPAGVLKLASEEQFLLWVELEIGRLSILERNEQGGMELREEIPVSIGKNGFGKQLEGDHKTPVGIYRLTSFLPDANLDDYYGLGAFPLNYPNVLDRKYHRTGSGIWLHGLPKDIDTRPLLDSDGCVVIDNDSLDQMHQYITTGITHIVLADEPLSWVPARIAGERGKALEQAFSAWRQAWESKDNTAYLSFYADDFSDFGRNKSQWSEYKSRVNEEKKWIQVDASQVSFFADMKNPELVTVRFYQDYKSSNYKWRGWKEQLWRESGNSWQIVYEGNG